MSRYDFTVVGTAASVSILKVNKMPSCGCSTAVYAGSFSEFRNGGMGFNIVAGLTKLGMKVYPVLTYADERQKDFLHSFARDNGLPEDGIDDPPKGSRGTTVMIQDANKNHMTLITEYEHRLPDSTYFHAQKMQDWFFRDSCFAILTAPFPKNTANAIDAIIRNRIPLVLSMRKDCNAFPHDLLWKAVRHAEIILANDAEAEYILAEFGLKDVQELFSYGKLHSFVETRGREGCRVYARDSTGKPFHHDISAVAMRKPIADTVGAGDGFVCGFMYAISKGMGLDEAALMGGTVSSFVLEKEGSIEGLPDERMMLERFSEQR